MLELLDVNPDDWKIKSDDELWRIKGILEHALHHPRLVPELQGELLVDISMINYILVSRFRCRYERLLSYIIPFS